MRVEAFRPGQAGAYRAVIELVLAGKKYIAIVLPTRYGKTDVIRMVAVKLVRDGLASCCVAVSPNKFLRDQSGSKKAMEEAFRRYSVGPCGFKSKRLTRMEANPTSNGEAFLSTTIQLVQQNVDVWTDWVESVLNTTGLPPVIFMDEAHTGSEDNEWGDALATLEKKGARIVLLTATPMRSDGKRIPGFKFELVEKEQVTRFKTRPSENEGMIWVDEYEGTAQKLRLVPDFAVSFRTAWNESPSPLCKLSRVPFDVNIQKIVGEEDGKDVMLSELSATDVRRVLSRVASDHAVISEGVSRLVENIQQRRTMFAASAGIVFCGNDERGCSGDDRHAKEIRAAIERIAPSMSVVIATSSDGNEGTEAIERFKAGQGDVLVVKQMASLGLDCPRLKTCLDLSTVRTPAAFIQRVMRIATPAGHVNAALYIAPDDKIGRDLWEVMISKEGGEVPTTVTDLELVESLEKEKGENELPVFIPNGIDTADFADSTGQTVGREHYPAAAAIMAAFPELNGVLTYPDVVRRTIELGIKMPAPVETVSDTGEIAAGLRADIELTVKEYVKNATRGAYTQEKWQELYRQVYNDSKKLAGIDTRIRLEDMSDIEQLRKLQRAVERVVSAANSAAL